MSKDTKFKDTWKPQCLYLEQYIISPEQFEKVEEKPENDDTERGVVIIDILSE